MRKRTILERAIVIMIGVIEEDGDLKDDLLCILKCGYVTYPAARRLAAGHTVLIVVQNVTWPHRFGPGSATSGRLTVGPDALTVHVQVPPKLAKESLSLANRENSQSLLAGRRYPRWPTPQIAKSDAAIKLTQVFMVCRPPTNIQWAWKSARMESASVTDKP